jgi:hypothetical protein
MPRHMRNVRASIAPRLTSSAAISSMDMPAAASISASTRTGRPSASRVHESVPSKIGLPTALLSSALIGDFMMSRHVSRRGSSFGARSAASAA